MKIRSTVLVAAATAGLMLAASPAFAWVCTAKNARGATYSAIGIFKANAEERALAKCKLGSVVNAGCHIISCVP